MYVTTTRRPFDALQSLRRLSTVLDEAFGSYQPEDGSTITAARYPACDVFEDKDAVKIVAEVPGVRPEDVKISLENNLLTIRGEKKQQAEERNERVHRYERSYGVFERGFALPSTVDSDKIHAAYENGVLTITVPKAERARPREISIKVS
jgi:HSP20 family protein